MAIWYANIKSINKQKNPIIQLTGAPPFLIRLNYTTANGNIRYHDD